MKENLPRRSLARLILALGLAVFATQPSAQGSPGDAAAVHAPHHHVDEGSIGEKSEGRGNGNDRLLICHRAGRSYRALSIPRSALSGHLRHGDCIMDDGIDCTVDLCDPVFGCVSKPDDARCDDGLFCSTETCTDEGCIAVSTCPPAIDGCVFVNDSCDEDNDVCVDRPDDSRCDDDDLCTVDSCDADTGECVNDPVNCDDGNLCTIDFCIPESGCQHGAVGCTTDNNECTDDACDPVTGGCPYRPVTDGFPCDDGIACTDGSFCLDGACVGGTSNCPQSQNRCLVPTCNYESGECEFCDDDEPPVCTEGGYPIGCPPSPDPCFGTNCFGNDGICRSVLVGDPQDCFNVHACDTNQDCADNDACSTDTCVLVGASRVCQWDFVDPEIVCNDNNLCTIDTCHASSGCVHMPLNPIAGCGGDDDLACTTQTCDPAIGCTKILDHSQCDDGLACTLDVCDGDVGCLNPPDPSACGNGVCDLPCGEHAGNCPTDCIGANSCVGTNACVGVTGQIGENSCIGTNACRYSDGIIGDNSCTNAFFDENAGACAGNTGTIGNDSCLDIGSCEGNSGQIGNDSCHEYKSCVGNSGEIGNNSCQPWRACCYTEIDIGDNQCNGVCACRGPECVLCGL